MGWEMADWIAKSTKTKYHHHRNCEQNQR